MRATSKASISNAKIWSARPPIQRGLQSRSRGNPSPKKIGNDAEELIEEEEEGDGDVAVSELVRNAGRRACAARRR